ncbi:MAG: hypothetical protein EOM54_10110 [Clostridia bacterium]|nr:hypothetical protein [Clostridia bacterium]
MDAEGNKQLQYPVYTDGALQTGVTAAQAALFGPTSLKTGREWIENDFPTLSSKNTAVYQQLIESGVSERDAYELVSEIRGATETGSLTRADAQARIIDKSDLSDEQKITVYYDIIASDKEKTVIDRLDGAGGLFEILSRLRSIDTAALKREALMNYDGLNSAQKMALDAELVCDKNNRSSAYDYTSREAFEASQLPDSQYAEFKELKQSIPDLNVEGYREFAEACALAETTEDGTRKEKIMAYIDRESLTNDQKTALYLAAGYSATTLYEAPWYGRSEPRYLPRGGADKTTEEILAKYGLKK